MLMWQVGCKVLKRVGYILLGSILPKKVTFEAFHRKLFEFYENHSKWTEYDETSYFFGKLPMVLVEFRIVCLVLSHYAMKKMIPK